MYLKKSLKMCNQKAHALKMFLKKKVTCKQSLDLLPRPILLIPMFLSTIILIYILYVYYASVPICCIYMILYRIA